MSTCLSGVLLEGFILSKDLLLQIFPVLEDLSAFDPAASKARTCRNLKKQLNVGPPWLYSIQSEVHS